MFWLWVVGLSLLAFVFHLSAWDQSMSLPLRRAFRWQPDMPAVVDHEEESNLEFIEAFSTLHLFMFCIILKKTLKHDTWKTWKIEDLRIAAPIEEMFVSTLPQTKTSHVLWRPRGIGENCDGTSLAFAATSQEIGKSLVVWFINFGPNFEVPVASVRCRRNGM